MLYQTSQGIGQSFDYHDIMTYKYIQVEYYFVHSSALHSTLQSGTP